MYVFHATLTKNTSVRKEFFTPHETETGNGVSFTPLNSNTQRHIVLAVNFKQRQLYPCLNGSAKFYVIDTLNFNFPFSCIYSLSSSNNEVLSCVSC